MKFTHYFQETRQRPDRAIIEIEWIEKTVKFPEKEFIQQDGRLRRWALIKQANNKWCG